MRFPEKLKKPSKSEGGYAAITLTVLTMAVSLSVITAFTFFSFKEATMSRLFSKSVETRYISEAGIEDATYRVIMGKNVDNQETLLVGGGSTTIIHTVNGNQQIIRSEGRRETLQRNSEARIDSTASGANFFYGVQAGDGGFELENNSVVNGSVYSNGSVEGESGARITSDVTVAGGIPANPSVEWLTNDANKFFANLSSNRDIAQSFIANASGPVSKVSIYLGKVGSPSSIINVRITIDDGGKPKNSSLESASISPSQVGATPSWIDVSFSDPPLLANGTKYWIVLDYGSNSSSNYWNWRKDSADGYAGNTAKYTDDWSNKNSVWINAGGDLSFRVWIGGQANEINGVTIGDAANGTGRANMFVNTSIHGSSCPNSYCIVDNPPRQELPISAGVIQDWKNEALQGGICAPPQCDVNGNLNVSGTVQVGPKKIPGNLTVTNGAILVVTGTLWVGGTMNFSNNCEVRLDSGYGLLSGVILGEGTISVSNNCVFQGSGSPGSYVMVLSDKTDHLNNVITVGNNSSGVIYYASDGWIELSNNASAREVTAYGIRLENNATVTYDSGLANMQFSSGPSGGYDFKYWKEAQ